MADAAPLADAYAALQAIGPPVKLDGDPDPEGEQTELIVLALVSDTSRQHYGGRTGTARIQTTCYAQTVLDAAALDSLCITALEAAGWQHLQTRPAPDPQFAGLLSEFTR